MKKRLLSILLTTALAVTALAGCKGTAPASAEAPAGGDETGTGTEASGEAAEDLNTLNVCLASEPDSLDPALNSAVDGASMIIHLFSGLAKWEKNEDGSFELVPDMATVLPDGEDHPDGTVTYTYTLRDGLKWSDGQDLKASDFEFAWNRAASAELAADYGYMFEVVKGYDDVADVDDEGNPLNPDAKLAVTALDDKTLEVTISNRVPYWNELLAFPAYFPVREDVVSDEAWATDPSTYVCNGPYTMTGWEHNSVITLTKNENYVDAADITMETLNFYLSDDENNMLTNFQNGDWQLIDNVPVNEIPALKEQYPDEFMITGQLGTYYVCWNINEKILPAGSPYENDEKAKSEIRSALGLLLDRNYIVNQISQGGELPASSFVAMGLTEPDGSQFYENAGDNDGFIGYYDVSEDAYTANFEQAMEVLKKYYTYDEASGQFTDFPTLTYLYNTDDNHKAIAEYIQSALAGIGITLNLENQEWATFLNTRKNGDYSLARNGWLGDYNDPISFLDMWVTGSGNNDVQFGKGDNAKVKTYTLDLSDCGSDIVVANGSWADTYDVLIRQLKNCTDENTRYKMMHKAEDMLMETGCIVPLYYYTDIFMISSDVKGFYTNPLGFKYFMYTTRQ